MPSGSTKTKSPTTAATGSRKSSSPTAAAKKIPAKEQAARDAAEKAAKHAGRAKKNAAQSSSPPPDEASSGSPKQKKKKKKTSSSLEDELAETKALLAAEKARRRKAELQLPNGAAPAATTDDKSRQWKPINHPGGSAGDDWSLQTVMRLQDRQKRYNALRLEVKRCVDMSGLDHRVVMNKQNREKLGMVCAMAREHQPYLGRFTDDWATIEFIRMLFKNRRQQDRIRAAAAAKEKAARRGRKNRDEGEEHSGEESDEDSQDSQDGSDGED
ncbi:hypothetical protein EXIGLDRAFT_701092 [Exidia glandulosa HHB12029]|uniref:Uncharacterized protein n=1 Tax=Exidia glandulosa HHB12029 TaxID=1314781 RepID=A0A165D459_EXIGL|nr:hypothetical protein EXIGLDRAFT_701092 [Exidia glandulosa HHB12029]